MQGNLKIKRTYSKFHFLINLVIFIYFSLYFTIQMFKIMSYFIYFSMSYLIYFS